MLFASHPDGTPQMTPDIRHDRSARRFETTVDGAHCELDYTLSEGRLAEGVMTITHTEVPQEVGGRGIAGALVRTALDVARAEGWKVRPRCPYAAAWMKRHPEYAELLA
jgi:predicted GNAT family acetyltransferase